MMSLQEEAMTHPADDAMTAWMDDTRLEGRKESDEQPILCVCSFRKSTESSQIKDRKTNVG